MLKEEGPEGEVFENDLPDVDYKGTQMVFCSLCDKTFASKSEKKFILFRKKRLIFWIIVIVVFYKNKQIIAT